MTKNVLLIITGSVAAYKSLDLIRQLQEQKCNTTCILTQGGAEFITPLSVASISGNPVYEDMFSLKDEVEMGHISLSRDNDVIVVAPASADIMAKMAQGLANDLASTVLLATNKPVILAPAMNHKMWENKAVQRNVAQLKEDGITILDPEEGQLACGEVGKGRLCELSVIVKAVSS